MAVAHARTRRQFNRPIGQFQAIKHKCADMLVLVECARSAAWYAAWAAVHEQAALPVAAAVAKATCSDAAFRCAAENIQIHGGLGFTWDHDAHLYFKRAKSSETFMGDSARQRDRVAHALGW
jgi:alkylation response protein AidB-like acyl-CoA dehydrogenase